MTTKEALTDFDKEFQTVRMTANSLLNILEMQILDTEVVSTLGINHPDHATQKSHALVVALQHQLSEAGRLVDELLETPP